MRYLVLSDMHANWLALEAVLDALPPEDFDQVLVLGDLVGYGARPDEVVEAVRGLPGGTQVIRGNHDKVVAGLESDELFNPAARRAIEWTREAVGTENLGFVRDLPEGPVEVAPGLVICHGTPHDEDAYVLSAEEALECFEASPARVILFGHTHVTCVFGMDTEHIEVRWSLEDGDRLEMEDGKRYLINPGSVGQPRDGDPRAACLTFDTESDVVRWHRIEYPVDRVQRQILDAGLPRFLAERLATGV